MAYYSHHRPMSKRAEDAPARNSVETAIGALNPLESNLANYGLYTGGGALAGARIGALINALRGKSIGRGALGGGLMGAGLGAGVKGLGDYGLSDEKGILDNRQNIEDRSSGPYDQTWFTQRGTDNAANSELLNRVSDPNYSLYEGLFGPKLNVSPTWE